MYNLINITLILTKLIFQQWIKLKCYFNIIDIPLKIFKIRFYIYIFQCNFNYTVFVNLLNFYFFFKNIYVVLYFIYNVF